MSDEQQSPRPEVPGEGELLAMKEESKRRQRILIWTAVVFVLIAICHRVFLSGGMGQTGAMFIGLPALLAVGLSFTPRAKTITGAIMRGITFTMLLMGILLIEGFICILMAAPLFYVVGLVVGICCDRAKVRNDMNRYRCSLLGVFGLMALEGVVPQLSFDRENEVVVEREVAGTLEEVRERLEFRPELALERLPGFLQLGFPRQSGMEKVGADRWRILFEEGKDAPTELTVRVKDEGPERVRYVIEEDGTKIAEWLTWQDGVWELEESTGGLVRATLTVRFRRELDPAWYFGPVERYGVEKAAGYFADEVLRERADGP
jgi:hypothetical protein